MRIMYNLLGAVGHHTHHTRLGIGMTFLMVMAALDDAVVWTIWVVLVHGMMMLWETVSGWHDFM